MEAGGGVAGRHGRVSKQGLSEASPANPRHEKGGQCHLFSITYRDYFMR